MPFSTFIIAIGVLFIIFLGYVMVRNEIVYRYRMRVLNDPSRPIEEQLANHRALPDYQAMVFDLFRFNWDEYLKHK